MIGRAARTTVGRTGGAAALTLATIGFASLTRPGRAAADPMQTPPYPTACLHQVAANPAKGAALNAAFAPYEVPFKAIIFDGSITIAPNIVIPHLFATACGDVQRPQLTGTITSSEIVVATPNVYIAGLEALPTDIGFGGLKADIVMTPAHNGGLDISVNGTTTASLSTLGMTCSLSLDASFTTLSDGVLSGQPVTGPTEEGQAVTVSNSFAVPTVIGSNTSTCPPSVAQAFNTALHLPAPAGVGRFNAPFCFDFELPNGNAYQPTGTGGQVNPNFVFSNAVPVSIGVSPAGIPLPSGLTSPILAYGTADGFLASSIDQQPAANGGLNLNFYSTTKSATDLSQPPPPRCPTPRPASRCRASR